MKKFISGFFLSLFMGCSAKETIKDPYLPACPDSPNCFIAIVPFEEPTLQLIKDKIILNVSLLKGDTLVDINESLKFSFKSNFFKFEDILEFYIDMDNKKVHIRSAAETGWYDFGVNKKRVLYFSTLLKK